MIENYTLEEKYEEFEGNIRKLDELIGQLELWSDEYTINHKKEEIRLPQYIELHNNLEELKQILYVFIQERVQEEGNTERIISYQDAIKKKLEAYKEAETTIHNWIRNIKDIRVLIMKSDILKSNKEYIEEIISKK